MKVVVNNYLPHPLEEAEEKSLICCRDSDLLLGATSVPAHESLAGCLQESASPPAPSSSSGSCPQGVPQGYTHRAPKLCRGYSAAVTTHQSSMTKEETTKQAITTPVISTSPCCGCWVSTHSPERADQPARPHKSQQATLSTFILYCSSSGSSIIYPDYLFMFYFQRQPALLESYHHLSSLPAPSLMPSAGDLGMVLPLLQAEPG